MKKRFLSMLLGIAMIISVIPNFVFAADESAFKDVSGSEYYAQSADVLAKLKILTGYSDGTFGADKPITRAEMAAVVCRMLGKEADAEQAKGKTSFDDVPENHWASGYINVATKEGIINGDGNGKFRPEDDIKFEEALKTIICVLGWGNNITINPADWSKAYLDIAADKQLDNNLKGSKGEKANRSDIAVMVYNGLKEDLKAPVASLKTGTYRGTKKITLTTDAKGAKIYYTTDGTTPTVDSTEYTKEISISKTGTLKAVAIRDGVLSSDVMSEDYTIKKAISRRGGGNSSKPEPSDPVYVVSFDLNYDGATGAPASQRVNSGEKATEPTAPVRDGYAFVGWSTTADGQVLFNFNTDITSNITLYAKWVLRNGNNPVSLDDPDPDVEIYSFNTDTYDILVGDSKTVTFTSEIFSNIELSDSDVAVVNENETVLGYMNDDGINGDAEADDGIWTLEHDFVAEDIQNILYYATVKNVVSNSVNIGFYKPHTEEEYKQTDNVSEQLNKSIASYIDANGYLIEDKYDAAIVELKNCLDALIVSGEVSSYEINEYDVSINLVNGIPFIYQLLIDNGTDAGMGNIKISTFQPYKNTYSDSSLNTLSDSATDGSAQKIATKSTEIAYVNYSFDGNFDLNGVTLESLKNIFSYQVILWHGHGGYDPIYGSSLMTGEEVNSSMSQIYDSDISNHRIMANYSAAGRNTYAITGGFIQKYVGNLNGAFVYLASCSSGLDMIDGKRNTYSLAQEFINKGATTVIANSGTISTRYNTTMERDVIDYMCKTDANGTYHTASEALSHAKAVNGSNDGVPVLFPQNNATASSYRFFREATGMISGNVKSAENSNEISNALVRVYQNGSLIKSARTDSNGYYNIELPVGDYIVKITAGNYKSAKMGVTVVENTTTYNETMLLVKVGLNTGYANGIITSALNGMGVPGVTLKLRNGVNNIYGNVVYMTTTNENGYYKVEYIPGTYTVEYSKEGYITGYRSIVIGIIDLAAQNASISPLLGDGAYRITLYWKNIPNDLDSHLTGPVENSSERFHLYYPMNERNGGHPNSDKYTLDLDNTDIVSRPEVYETTTILKQIDGVYRFSVHDYSNSGSTTSTAMANSQATVNVYKGNSNIPVATFHVPTTAVGSIWTVFEINGDTITPINRISAGNDSNISLFGLNNASSLYDEDIIMETVGEK